MYAAGVETLFNLDILRDVKMENMFFDALRSFDSKGLVLSGIPRIFESFIGFVKRHRSALFGQGSGHSAGSSVAEVQEAGMRFYFALRSLVDGRPECEAWSTRVKLLILVDRENLYSSQQPNIDAKLTLQQDIELAITSLGSSKKGLCICSVIHRLS